MMINIILMLITVIVIVKLEDFISDFIAENGRVTCVENLHPILGDGCLSDNTNDKKY